MSKTKVNLAPPRENTAERWGAYPEDWDYFSQTLGITEDLLPVVCNPNAKISPASKLKALGKVPSEYNANGEVVGIPNWTAYRATERDVESWKRNPDYGICVQTRLLRAYDIDIENKALAERAQAFFENAAGFPMSCRYRDNSGKCLLVFKQPGKFAKQSVRVEGGIVEFLANGQQFVAIGTHTSGVRYKWHHLGAGMRIIQTPTLQ